MKKYLLIAAAALAAVLTISCKKEKIEPSLELKSQASASVAASGGTVELSFTTNQDWTVSSSAAWAVAEPAKGNASDKALKVTVSVAANDSEAERTATITVKAAALKKEVTIKQAGKTAVVPEASLTLKSPEAVTAAAEGADFDVTFATNKDWTIAVSETWATVDPVKGNASDADITVKLSVAANEVKEARSATLTITAENLTRTVTINQVAAEDSHVGPIMTAAQFLEFADSVNAGRGNLDKWLCEDGTYQLGADLDFTGLKFMPVGSEKAPFTGVFDGKGHTLDNIKFETPRDADGNLVDLQYQAVFGYIGNDGADLPKATVKNFTVGPNSYFKASRAGGSWIRVAGCVSYISVGSKVENLTNKAEVTIVAAGPASAKRLAGCVASSKGEVDGCVNYGKVWYNPEVKTASTSTSQYAMGGVVGFSGDVSTKVSNCTNYGEVDINFDEISQRADNTKANNNIGGVVGLLVGKSGSYKAYGENLVNEGKISISGGLADEAWNRFGGVIGFSSYAEVSNLTNSGEVSIDKFGAKVRMGGVIGYVNGAAGTDGKVEKAINTGRIYAGAGVSPVSGKDAFLVLGAVIGMIENPSNATDLTNEGTLVSDVKEIKPRLGGVVGQIAATCGIDGAINKGSVVASAPANIGGIAGFINKADGYVKNTKMQGSIVMAEAQEDADNYTVGLVVGHGALGVIEGNLVCPGASFAVADKAPVVIDGSNYEAVVVKDSDFTDKNIHIKAIGGRDSLDGVAFDGQTTPEQPGDFLDLKSDAAVAVAAAGADIEVVIATNLAWTAASDAEWAVVAPASGEASETDIKLTVAIAANETDAERVANVTITAGEMTKTVTITQATGTQAPVEAKEITTAEELQAFLNASVDENSDLSAWIVDGEVRLGADIDLAGVSLTSAKNFYGVFNGQNHSIKNWNTTVPLFEALGKTGATGIVVKNLILDESCTYTVSGSGRFGMLAKTSWAELANIVNNAEVKCVSDLGKSFVGSLTGCNVGYMHGCVNNGKVYIDATKATSAISLGGLAGTAKGTDYDRNFVLIENCVNNGHVYASYSGTPKNNYIGGIVGSTTEVNKAAEAANNAIIKDCHNNGKVELYIGTLGSGTYSDVGGVAGYWEGSMIGCSNKATGVVNIRTKLDPTGNCTRPAIGGVAGYVFYSGEDCWNEGNVLLEGTFAAGTGGNAGAGGSHQVLVGGVFGGAGDTKVIAGEVVKNCYNKGTVTQQAIQKNGGGTQSPIGGVVGYSSNLIEGCYNIGKVKSSAGQKTSFVGGVAGRVLSDVVSSYNAGEIEVDGLGGTANSSNAFASHIQVAGVVANMGAAGKVTNCENRANASISVYNGWNQAQLCSVGGVMASSTADKPVEMSGCKNEGSISVDSPNPFMVGGIAGNVEGQVSSSVWNGAIKMFNTTAPAGYISVVGGIAGVANGSLSGNEAAGRLENASAPGTAASALVGEAKTALTIAGGTVDAQVRSVENTLAGLVLGRSAGVAVVAGTAEAPIVVKSTSTLNDVPASASSLIGEGEVDTTNVTIQ